MDIKSPADIERLFGEKFWPKWYKRRGGDLGNSFFDKDTAKKLPKLIFDIVKKNEEKLDDMSTTLDHHKVAACVVAVFQKSSTAVFKTQITPTKTKPVARKLQKFYQACLALDLFVSILMDMDQTRFYLHPERYGDLFCMFYDEKNELLALSMIAYQLEREFRLKTIT